MTWQYIAGFFDGEGSFCHNGKGFRITISQTDENVLNEIKKFTGLGNVIKVTKRRDHWKDAWVYYIAKQEDVLTFTQNTTEYLLVKKDILIDAQKKLQRAVAGIQEKEINICDSLIKRKHYDKKV